MTLKIAIRKIIVTGGYLYLTLMLSFGAVYAGSKYDILKINTTYPTEEEFLSLPRYCKVRDELSIEKKAYASDKIKREGEYWDKRIGKGLFHYTHHYCAGLNRINRYKRSLRIDEIKPIRPGEDQVFTLKYAIQEFNFMEKYFHDAKSPLYPELLVKKAYALWQLNQGQEAFKYAMKAIKVKPRYPKSYLLLADIYESQGNFKNAQNILELGVKKTKGDSLLKARLQRQQNK